MKKNVFAVCDLEVDYARNFMEYLNRKKNLPFEIQAFTTAEGLIAYGKNSHIELLLISGKAMCREIRELDIGKIVILSEGVHAPELDEYPSVYKYQSSAQVVREVMACYGEERSVIPAEFPVLKKTTEILGIYSPLGRCLKTSFALALAQVLAREKAVLYVNLEEFSGFESLLGREFAHDLSDLLYYVRQRSQNLIHRMNGIIQTVNNVDFIPPVKMPADIRSTSWEDWEYLLNEITLHSNYETVVLDIGNGTEELFQLLDRCRKIYMPVLKDEISAHKLRQFENLLCAWDFSQVLSKTEKLHLPFHAGKAPAESYVEQLPWSELGDRVRELLRKEKE